MEPIIEPVSLDLLKAELTSGRKLRDTNKGKNEIYVVNCHNSPNVMREIGRLREVAFRDSGGGSGLSKKGRIDIFTPQGHAMCYKLGVGSCSIKIVRLGW